VALTARRVGSSRVATLKVTRSGKAVAGRRVTLVVSKKSYRTTTSSKGVAKVRIPLKGSIVVSSVVTVK
jgi:hypothetical protein